MVQEFNDAAFNKLDQGKPSKVRTQFGWHVIEVTGKKFTSNQSGMQVAQINVPITPLKPTLDNFRSQAENLANSCRTLDQLKAEAAKLNMEVSQGAPVRENDFSVGSAATGSDARSIIRWAFKPETKAGSVSKDVFTVVDPKTFVDGKYIIAAVRSIRPKGYARVEDVKDMIKPQVISRKRGEMLLAQIKDASNLGALASQFGVTVDTAASASFASPQLGPGGYEPKVVGQVFSLAEGQLTKPFIGNSGVFVATGCKSATPVQAPGDVSMFKRQYNQIASQISQRMVSTLRKSADVQDFRSKSE